MGVVKQRLDSHCYTKTKEGNHYRFFSYRMTCISQTVQNRLAAFGHFLCGRTSLAAWLNGQKERLFAAPMLSAQHTTRDLGGEKTALLWKSNIFK